jgi:cytoskeletal protein CcmA (bactofilin family)
MFRKRTETDMQITPPPPTERVTSVLGPGIFWKGNLNGRGGVRIEGAFEGDINLRGLLVVGDAGRVTSKTIRVNVVIVAGALRADEIIAEKLEIRRTGRIWGDVVTASFATEEGSFLRGQIRMEDHIDLGALPAVEDNVSIEEAPAPSNPE